MPGWPAREARNSSIARWVDRSFPTAPDTLQALRRLVGSQAFPQVFNALGRMDDGTNYHVDPDNIN